MSTKLIHQKVVNFMNFDFCVFKVLQCIGLASVKGNIYLSSYISIHKGSYKLELIFIKYFFSSSYPNPQLFIIPKAYYHY